VNWMWRASMAPLFDYEPGGTLFHYICNNRSYNYYSDGTCLATNFVCCVLTTAAR